jgi:GNAT superfamily N-acetyltransferase
VPEGLFVKPRLYDTKELLETIIDGWVLGVYDDGIDELDVGTASVVFENSVQKKMHFKLRLLVVDPGVRGRGIGSKLLEASQQFAISKILNRQDRCVIEKKRLY